MIQNRLLLLILAFPAIANLSAQETVRPNNASKLERQIRAITDRLEYHNADLEQKRLKRLMPKPKEDEDEFMVKYVPVIKHISIVRLIATPEKYRKKPVRISGYMQVERENIAVYLSREDAAHLFGKNAIWVDLDYDAMIKAGVDPVLFHCRYVSIEGIFSHREDDEYGDNSGEIQSVWRITAVSPRELIPHKPDSKEPEKKAEKK